MKWALTSPDGLGDFLLRLPWLLTMQEAGWELTLLSREPTIELATMAGLKAEMVALRMSPYSKEARRHPDPFRKERQIAESCELVFFGPTQPSFFEEELARTLQKNRLAGFVLEENFWPSESVAEPAEIARRFDLRISVKNSDPEPVRNRRAASALLGKEVSCPPFHFPESAVFQKPGGIPPQGPYTVVCAGYRKGDYFTGMGTNRWIDELRRFERETTFVLTGSMAEAPAHEAILAGLIEPARHVNLTGRLGSLEELLAVLSGAEMIVGKDSGTMHLAAALRKPLVAVFGGGHWGRFFPTGTRAVIVSAKVPCRHCDWRCHIPEPACVAGLPAGSVAAARQTLLASDSEELILNEYLPDGHHRAMAESPDAAGFPAKVHKERKARLAAEMKASRGSILQRLRGRLPSRPR